MKATFTHIFFISLIAICSSCISYVTVQKTLPPETILPKETADFLFVNRFEPDDLDYNNKNKIEVYDIGLENFIRGLKAGFDTSRHYHLTLSDTLLPSHSAHEPAFNLTPEIAKKLCQDYQQDYVLTLDNFDLFFDKEIEVTENDDGSKNKTAYYDLVLNTFITIYDVDGQSIEKIQDEIRILHKERMVLSGLFTIGPSMGKTDKNTRLISDELGRDFILKLYPLSISEMRKFYATKEFSNAFKAYNMQKWTTVEEELIKLTKSSDSKVEGRAAYNLSILYENLNRTSEMEFWHRKALDKLGSKMPSNNDLF